ESRRDSATKPRVARNELPWVRRGRVMTTLKGLCQIFGPAYRETAPQPFRGWFSLARLPRVARPSQPWAGGLNPFGIEDPCKVQTGLPHSKTLARPPCASEPPPGFGVRQPCAA